MISRKNRPFEAPPGVLRIVKEVLRAPWTMWVGYRYLKSKKNSKFLSLITLLSTAGVALGVTSMIVVLSVMDGFEGELKKRLMSTDLHILMTPRAETEGVQNGTIPREKIEGQPAFQALVKDPGVAAVWPMLTTEVIFKVGRKVTGVVVKGITSERQAELARQLTEKGEPQMMFSREEGGEPVRLPSLFIGQELAHELFLIPGDRVMLISPIYTDGPTGSIPRTKAFVVEGIYQSGLPEQELHTVFAPIETLESFLDRKGAVSQWEVVVKNFEEAPRFARAWSESLTGLRIRDWVQLNDHLFHSLRLERIAMFLIMAFIVVVASFNIVTTLTLMVLQKKREISILKAIGASSAQVSAIFLAEGVLIGLSGVGLGSVLGWGICMALKRYEFIQLPDIYYDRNLPVSFTAEYLALIALSALLIVLAACLYPSRKAARFTPLDGIRFGI